MSPIQSEPRDVPRPRHRQPDRAVIDRLAELTVILPALAQDAAVARREAARLRVDNRRLASSLAELQARTSMVSCARVDG